MKTDSNPGQISSERGYITKFQQLDALAFGLPQSRLYGVSARLTDGFGQDGHAKTSSKLAAAWELTTRFQLQQLWQRVGSMETPKTKMQKGHQHAKDTCKWPKYHDNFINKEDLMPSLSLPQVTWAHECFKALALLLDQASI